MAYPRDIRELRGYIRKTRSILSKGRKANEDVIDQDSGFVPAVRTTHQYNQR